MRGFLLWAPEFVDNPEPRCACLLLLDTSGSMSGSKIQQRNEGRRAFEHELKADSLSSKRVEVGIVTFGSVQVPQRSSYPLASFTRPS